MAMIFEMERHLWLDAICQNQNLGKNLLAEETLLADQRQCQYGWVNDINTPTTSPIPVAIWSLTVRASSYRHYLICYEKQDTGTGKLGRLCSGKKASRRKCKSENETEIPNTSYLVIMTGKENFISYLAPSLGFHWIIFPTS